MNIKLAHPLWTHLPAVAALLLFIVFLITGGPFPSEAPVHFNINGEPDSYGSPWQAFGLTIGLSVFYILLSVFLDNLWVKQESRKTFNWLSLLDEIVVGALVGINMGYFEFLNKGSASFNFPWIYLLTFCGGTVVLAVILELVRPYRPQAIESISVETSGIKDTVIQRLKHNSTFVYWDYQNPLYITLLTTLLPAIMLVVSIYTWFNEPWAAVVVALAGIALIIPYGGQRTVVTREEISIRWGILGFRVLKLRTTDIITAEFHRFAPLRDFGGYGIRFNGEMTAYYMRGTTGVKITTSGGKKYLIGSDSPERLLPVIQAVAGK